MDKIFLDGKSGLAGNLWASAMAGLGADDSIIYKAGPALGLDIKAELVLKEIIYLDLPTFVSRLNLNGTDKPLIMSYKEMNKALLEADAPKDVVKKAAEVLYLRQSAEAGKNLFEKIYFGESVGDTLFDVLAGVWLWFDLGCPEIVLSSPLNIGSSPPRATLDLTQNIPVSKAYDGPKELTTPTGAALLSVAYSALETAQPSAQDRICLSEAAFSDKGIVSPLLCWRSLI